MNRGWTMLEVEDATEQGAAESLSSAVKSSRLRLTVAASRRGGHSA